MTEVTWHAEIRLKTAEPHAEDRGSFFAAYIERMLETLDDLSPVASVGTNGLQLFLTIEHPDALQAMAEAMSRVHGTLMECGIGTYEIAYASLQEWGDYEDSLGEATHPSIVGIAEIADIAGVSRQRASQLAQSTSFPMPHERLASGPVWLLPNVMKFIEGWTRKPGRPPKTAEEPGTVATG